MEIMKECNSVWVIYVAVCEDELGLYRSQLRHLLIYSYIIARVVLQDILRLGEANRFAVVSG